MRVKTHDLSARIIFVHSQTRDTIPLSTVAYNRFISPQNLESLPLLYTYKKGSAIFLKFPTARNQRILRDPRKKCDCLLPKKSPDDLK